MGTWWVKPLISVLSLFLRVVFRLLGGLRAEGQGNIPDSGGMILAPNHLSWSDPPSLFLCVNRKCWFMGNDFLFRIPVLGKLIPHFGAFPVHRGQIDRDALRVAEKHLQDGDLLCVFPEGGTTITGTLYPFEGGVALLSIRNNVPIIPVGITGTDKLLPTKPPTRPHFVRGGVVIRFGKPIHPDEVDPSLPKKQRVELLTNRLYHAVAELLPPEYLPDVLHTPVAPSRDR